MPSIAPHLVKQRLGESESHFVVYDVAGDGEAGIATKASRCIFRAPSPADFSMTLRHLPSVVTAHLSLMLTSVPAILSVQCEYEDPKSRRRATFSYATISDVGDSLPDNSSFLRFLSNTTK